YLVIVDGLDARHFVSAAKTPHLYEGGPGIERLSHLQARAVMPTRTNPNHVSLLTGTWPETHGITGNAYWSRQLGAPIDKPEQRRFIEGAPLLRGVKAVAPALTTVGVFAKPKLARLFSREPGRQSGPDVLWSPERAPDTGRDPSTGYSTDAATMDGLLDATAK